ncbi:hypothetical protein [Deinococcus hohokamensis]|uniref:Uncharacterized protein n=1 Tax=Deinococcus hohokamensis TaxID=309883 RepID=A0ABV9ID70_9DEIO
MSKIYEGSSRTGDFSEALRLAIDQAKTDRPEADPLITWHLAAVRGQHGGFAGLNQITVIIEVKQL